MHGLTDLNACVVENYVAPYLTKVSGLSFNQFSQLRDTNRNLCLDMCARFKPMLKLESAYRDYLDYSVR